MCKSSANFGGSVFGVKGSTYTQQNMAMSHAGYEIGRKFGIPQNLYWQSKNILAYLFPFRLAIQIFFGMPVPHFGLPFGTWHAGISHQAHVLIPETT